MCRRIEEEVEPTVGLPRHRHFVGFFNVPVQTPTRDPHFYGYSEKPPHFSRLLRHAWGYGGHILDLNPPGPQHHRHFVELFNVPVQAPTWATLFTVIPRDRPI